MINMNAVIQKQVMKYCTNTIIIDSLLLRHRTGASFLHSLRAMLFLVNAFGARRETAVARPRGLY